MKFHSHFTFIFYLLKPIEAILQLLLNIIFLGLFVEMIQNV